MKCLFLLLLSFFIVSCSTNDEQKERDATSINNAEQEACNWCGTGEAPEDVSWRTVIPPEGEPGEKLIISGTVFYPDGKTSAQNVIVYVYHTNREGKYPKRGNESGNGQYHGYLRGWMKTDSAGRYAFETIRPTAYHSHGGEPAHIHYTIEAADYPEYWLTALWFEDDPRITDDYLNSVQRSGGFSNVVALAKDENGVLRGERNIILEKFNQ